jgi:hypothetical protein
LRINNNGAVVLRGGSATASGVGITFPATQSASSDANTLDDYEEGTWTPAVGTGTTYTLQSGKYTKIGNQVTIVAVIQINALGSTATTVSGLPFAFSFVANSNSSATVAYYASTAVNVGWINGSIPDGATTMTFVGSASASNTITSTYALWGNSTRVDFNATYLTS